MIIDCTQTQKRLPRYKVVNVDTCEEDCEFLRSVEYELHHDEELFNMEISDTAR